MYTFKNRCLENLQLELANDVTMMFLNVYGKIGDVTPQMVNFLEYVKTQVPNDDYTRELEAEVERLKLDKEVRRKYMVLQAELRDTQIIAFEAGEAKGQVDQLASMVKRKMQIKNMTCEEALEALDCTPEERQAYYEYVAKKQ